MTLQDARAYLRRVTYKPGWIYNIVDTELSCTAPIVDLVAKVPRGETVTFTVRCFVEELDESSLGIAIWLLTQRLENHELSEWLKLDGHNLMPPHGRISTYL